ncbi:hypothetical protein BDK62_12419 [Halomonas alkaliantarctica]|nr:hypothetical protein BDK62_12419 [Halomonas alkaliantarctica]
MSHHSNTQPSRSAKQVFGEVQAIAQQSNVNDWYDTTTLAQEHLEQAGSLFHAIMVLLEKEHGANHRIKDLVGLGMTVADDAAARFENQAYRLDQALQLKGAA